MSNRDTRSPIDTVIENYYANPTEQTAAEVFLQSHSDAYIAFLAWKELHPSKIEMLKEKILSLITERIRL